jgi:hypothetical protein
MNDSCLSPKVTVQFVTLVVCALSFSFSSRSAVVGERSQDSYAFRPSGLAPLDRQESRSSSMTRLSFVHNCISQFSLLINHPDEIGYKFKPKHVRHPSGVWCDCLRLDCLESHTGRSSIWKGMIPWLTVAKTREHGSDPSLQSRKTRCRCG